MDLARQLLAVGFVLSLVWLTAHLLRRKHSGAWQFGWGMGRSNAMLRPASRLLLGPQHVLHLVRAGDRGLLLAVHHGGCTLIESRPWSEWERCSLSAGEVPPQ